MEFDELTEEQKEKIRECKTSEEILAVVEEEDIELSEDQLEAVSGGGLEWTSPCNDLGN